MAAFLIDLDGTIFYWGTENLLPNVPEILKAWEARGDQIIFTTMRDEMWSQKAAEVLKEFLSDFRIVTQVDSPRIVINDDGAVAINHQRDNPWPQEYLNLGDSV